MSSWNGYVEIPSVRKLFVVPIAENNRGKSLIIRALLRLAGAKVSGWKRGDIALMTFSGQIISALVFPASLPEMQHREPHRTKVEDFLLGLDRHWWTYDLIVLPSHEDLNDVDEMLLVGQRHGYDMIAVSITRDETVMSVLHKDCLGRAWNERWTLRNPTIVKFQVVPKKLGPLSQKGHVQIDTLAGQLWTRIQRNMFP